MRVVRLEPVSIIVDFMYLDSSFLYFPVGSIGWNLGVFLLTLCFCIFPFVFSSGVDRLEPVSIFVDFMNLYFSFCIFQWGSFGFTSCVVPYVRHVPFISFV